MDESDKPAAEEAIWGDIDVTEQDDCHNAAAGKREDGQIDPPRKSHNSEKPKSVFQFVSPCAIGVMGPTLCG